VEEYVRRAQLDPMAPKVTLLDYAMSPTEMEVMFNQVRIHYGQTRYDWVQ
jgi:hypothetical protein